MPISTPTHLDNAVVAGTAATVASASISPSANALLIVCCTIAEPSDAGAFNYNTTGIGDTFSGTGTWTQHEHPQQDPAISSRGALYTAKAGSSPGSGVITVGYTRSANRRMILDVIEIASGFNTTTPVKQSKPAVDGGAGASTYSVTLDSSPDSDSCQIAFITVEDDSNLLVTEGTDYTELADNNTGGSQDLTQQVEYDLTAPSDGVADWSDTTGDAMIAVAIEVDAAAAGPGRTTKNTDSNPLGIHTGMAWRINQP